jgi:hypothetical protein
MSGRRLFFRSIAIIELVSLFFLFLILLESIDSSCDSKLFADSISLLLCLFETVRRVYLIVCVALKLKIL